MKKAITIFLQFVTLVALNAQGYYMEYKISSSAGAEGSISGNMKSYSQDGNSRMEMAMNVAGMGSMDMVSLYLKSSPSNFYLLNQKDKTYTKLTTTDNEDWNDYPQSDYEVTVVGKEKVNGYNTTHIKVRRKGSKSDMEMWNTTEISGYADFAKLKTKYTGKDNLLKAMELKGASGFPVRIRAAEEKYSIQMDLVKAERKNNPASLFSLDGYTEQTGSGLVPGIGNVQEMMQNIQNMTPEEREKWIKQMQDLYKPKD